MGEISKGVVIGVITSTFIMALFLSASGVLTPGLPPQDADASGLGPFEVDVARIGPDGGSETVYGEDLANVAIPGSEAFHFCTVAEIKVQRPSVMISSMPDSYCSLTRGSDGKWLLSTGGWQECRVTCMRIKPAEAT